MHVCPPPLLPTAHYCAFAHSRRPVFVCVFLAQATDQNIDGGARVLEFREMVQAINEKIGMRLVMDVVYNHVVEAGQLGEKSVLDKIVPGYYLRLDSSGQVQLADACGTREELFHHASAATLSHPRRKGRPNLTWNINWDM